MSLSRAARGFRAWERLGVSIGDVEGPAAAPGGALPAAGALIRDERPGEPAAQGGVRAGDIVVEVDGQPVLEPRDLQQIVAGLPPGKAIPVGVLREGRRETLTVQIGEAPDEVR